MKSTMKLHPFYDVVSEATEKIERHKAMTYQQFNCAHCGVKQTMDEKNLFYKIGRCEECGKLTDIEKDGCNYMAYYGSNQGARDVMDAVMASLKNKK